MRKVLDLGGGTGGYSLRLQNEGLDVVLLDFSPTAVAKAAAQGVARTICADFMTHDFAGERFDVVFCKGFSPLNTDDDEEFDRVMKRIDLLLAPGGGVAYWARTDDSERWTDSGWYCPSLARITRHFERAVLLPKFHRQLSLPMWLNLAVSALYRLRLRMRPRETLLIATRRRRD